MTMNQGLPTLYSRRSDGGVQTWRILVHGGRFQMISGVKGGAETASEWTVCQGKNFGAKNATSPEQQALKEARAKWQKKLDGGYKIDEKDIDNQSVFWPMLAEKYADYKENVVFPIYCQPKLDGARCIIRADGMWSREGKPFVSAPHIYEALKPIFSADPELVFDGELYADKLATDFNKIISLAKKKNPTPAQLAESAATLEYHIYDLTSDRMDHPLASVVFSQRSRELKTYLLVAANSKLKYVETVLAGSQEELDECYGRWLEQGYEGQMIRIDMAYEQKRSRYLLKRKEFKDEEYPLLDVTEGKGNRSGMAGRCHFKTEAGVEFEAGIRGNRDFYRRLLAEREQLKGKLCTVRYQCMTPGDRPKPRFAVVISVRDYD